MTNLEQLVECAKVLLVVDDSSKEVAAVQLETSKLPNLKAQIQELTAYSGCIDHTKEHQETCTVFLL